jgi:hypothetical protein
MTENTKKIEKWTKSELIKFIEDWKEIIEKSDQDLNKFTEFYKENEAKINDIPNIINTIKSSKNSVEQLKSQSNVFFEELKTTKEKISSLKTELDESKKEIDLFYKKIFTSQEKTESNPDGLSVSKYLDKFQEDNKIEFSKIKETWEEKYSELEEKIESLLPSATSAGLASSFKAGKEDNKKAGWLWFGFIGSLISLLLFYGYSFVYKDISAITIPTIIVRLSLGLPLIWIAWFCQKTISEQKRIKEEYHHKERIMSLYDGFIKHMQSLPIGESEESKNLIKIMLNAISVNPAEILNKELNISKKCSFQKRALNNKDDKANDKL